MTDNDFKDTLPDELNVGAFVGPYRFPDNSRRRIPGLIYLGLAIITMTLWFLGRNDENGLVSNGLFLAAIALAVIGIFSVTSAWRMKVDEKMALVHASQAVGFTVAHASAQQVWRGLRSRPTWRVFCYSEQDPPLKRGLVLIDAIDGRIVECLVEENTQG